MQRHRLLVRFSLMIAAVLLLLIYGGRNVTSAQSAPLIADSWNSAFYSSLYPGGDASGGEPIWGELMSGSGSHPGHPGHLTANPSPPGHLSGFPGLPGHLTANPSPPGHLSGFRNPSGHQPKGAPAQSGNKDHDTDNQGSNNDSHPGDNSGNNGNKGGHH